MSRRLPPGRILFPTLVLSYVAAIIDENQSSSLGTYSYSLEYGSDVSWARTSNNETTQKTEEMAGSSIILSMNNELEIIGEKPDVRSDGAIGMAVYFIMLPERRSLVENFIKESGLEERYVSRFEPATPKASVDFEAMTRAGEVHVHPYSICICAFQS